MDIGLLGYPVCHQLAERSFKFGALVMPLCSRCSGIYLGFFFTIIFLSGITGFRSRGVKLPEFRYLIVLMFFILIMGVDVFSDRLGLYQTNNKIRLLTGLLMGVSLANILLPVFNFTFWRKNERTALLDGRVFLKLLLCVILIFFAVLSLEVRLFWVLAIASLLGLITLYLCINGLIYLIVFKKENLADDWKALISLGMIASIMSAAEFWVLASIKSRL